MKFVMGIDPGEQRCGVAILQTDIGNAEATLIAGLRPTVQELGTIIEQWYQKVDADLFLAYEQYREYPWMAAKHKFNRMQTSEAIGVLEYLIKKYSIPNIKFMAGIWKPIVTDARLKELDFWNEYERTAARHIRDSTGIAVYAWKYRGVFNNGNRVITKADQIKLDNI